MPSWRPVLSSPADGPTCRQAGAEVVDLRRVPAPARRARGSRTDDDRLGEIVTLTTREGLSPPEEASESRQALLLVTPEP